MLLLFFEYIYIMLSGKVHVLVELFKIFHLCHHTIL